MKRLRDQEIAEIIQGNTLLLSCQVPGHCGGGLEIPFRPGIGGAPDGEPLANGVIWQRESGETLDDLTLSPSINANACGHFHIQNGNIIP